MGRVCVAGYGFPAGRLGCQAQQSAPRGLALGFAALSANLRSLWRAALRTSRHRGQVLFFASKRKDLTSYPP